MTRQNIEAEKSFFDSFTEQSDYDVFSDGGYDRLMKEFHRVVRPKKGEKILDLGCGTGAFTERFSKMGLHVTGIDISKNSIAKARKKVKKAKFIVADITKLPFKSNSIDIVCFSEVLHHFPNNAVAAIKEARRVLKPGGRCIGIDPNGRNLAMILFRDPKSPFCSIKGKTENERMVYEETLVNEYKKAGFRNPTAWAISNVPYKFVYGVIAKLFLIPYNAYDFFLGISPFAKRYGSVLISFAKK